jgi:CDP-paratose 2-epimerase
MKILITGHRGFIGQVVWKELTSAGHNVYGLDNLSRSSSTALDNQNSIVGDVTSIAGIKQLDIDFDWVIHLAAQVSVVEGELDPIADFNSNALGTFEVVQWAKKRNAKLIYSSSNKVFGNLIGNSIPTIDSAPLLPVTNYGISKCVGAHYVSDYENGWALHQSCIYGETQIGDINQGWIGWLRQSLDQGVEITCFGDGSQIRDLLHVNDLVNLYRMILDGKIKSGSYVVGGGIDNAYSFKQVVEILGGHISNYKDWRPNDQKYFVSANVGLNSQGWEPKVNFHQNLSNLIGKNG